MSDGTGCDDSELARIERWFHAMITHPDGVDSGAQSESALKETSMGSDSIEQMLTPSQTLSARDRLSIYADAYYSRLLECLGEVYPILKRTLGEETFNAFAFGYLQGYPSRSYTLHELGRHFPRYLEETRPVGSELGENEEEEEGVNESEDQPSWPDFLIDLARFEWTIYEVFDGPGVEHEPLLKTEALLGIPAEHWPSVCLKPVVCLHLLETRFPVNAYYTKLRQAPEQESVDAPEAAPSFAAITRRHFIVRRYELSRSQYSLLKSLQAGLPLLKAVQEMDLANEDQHEDFAVELQLWFRNWTAEGFFQKIERSDGECV